MMIHMKRYMHFRGFIKIVHHFYNYLFWF